MSDWRVGSHYKIHVYECSREDGQPSDDDRPVATFHTVMDARAAVEAHNTRADVVVEVDPEAEAAIVDRAVSVALDVWHAASHAEATNLVAMRSVVEAVQAVFARGA